MPNRIFAIRYDNTDCLVHLFFTEEYLTINLLNNELADDMGFSSFTIDRQGKLVNNISPLNAINTEAAMELFKILLHTKSEYLDAFQFNTFANQFAKAG